MLTQCIEIHFINTTTCLIVCKRVKDNKEMKCCVNLVFSSIQRGLKGAKARNFNGDIAC